MTELWRGLPAAQADVVRTSRVRSRLAAKHLVVVSVNHRVGVFGFVDLSSCAGPENAQFGNAGMLDITIVQ